MPFSFNFKEEVGLTNVLYEIITDATPNKINIIREIHHILENVIWEYKR
jgi:hypothetical protein